MVSLEFDPKTGDPIDDYESNCRKHDKGIEKAEEVVRLFGEMIEPRDLETMQKAYYSIVNSPYFAASAVRQSVVASTLSSCWDGIGPWKN